MSAELQKIEKEIFRLKEKRTEIRKTGAPVYLPCHTQQGTLERRAVMSTAVVFHAVYPIGDTDTNALPVQDLVAAITYYTDVLGFTLVTQDEHKAVLRRDTVQIGLAPNGQDPEQASCYFAVSSVEALRAELEGKPIALSPSRLDDHGGKKYQVFFGKEPFGVCFCFGQPAQP